MCKYFDGNKFFTQLNWAGEQRLSRSAAQTAGSNDNGDKTMQKFTPTLAAALCATALSMSVSQAATPPVKIGVLTDMSGTYASMGGMGSVATSAVPVLENMKSTSGRVLTAASTLRCIRKDCSREVEGTREDASARFFSSSCGMNS